MKYIKLFEDIEEKEWRNAYSKSKAEKIEKENEIKEKVSKFKKYIIYKDNRRLLIIEQDYFVFCGGRLLLHGEKKFIYLYDVGKLTQTEGTIVLDEKNIDPIIFTSDDIEECKDKLLIIANQIKFNI